MATDESDQFAATEDSLDQRLSRLSINIGAGVSKIGDPQGQQIFLAGAMIETLEDLMQRGLSLREAATMADDIIAGARIIAARLQARPSAEVLAFRPGITGTGAAD